jgi:hypothetical protein
MQQYPASGMNPRVDWPTRTAYPIVGVCSSVAGGTQSFWCMRGVPSGHRKSMHETDLQLHPAEASDLCELDAPDLLARRRWDRALLTVMDEAPVESALAVLGHEPRR